jgi:hypothetical protein
VSLGASGPVWKRDDDCVWQILFDDGIRPAPASVGQAAAFIATRSLSVRLTIHCPANARSSQAAACAPRTLTNA